MFNIQQTEEYKAIQELQLMDTCASNALSNLNSYTQQAYLAFWKGEISPIIKIQMLGTKALAVFTALQQAQAFIASQIEGYEMLNTPAEYEIVWNEDGSGIINEVVIEEVIE